MNFITKIYNLIVPECINIGFCYLNSFLVISFLLNQIIANYIAYYLVTLVSNFIFQTILDIYYLTISYLYQEYNNRDYYIVNKFNTACFFVNNIFVITKNIIFKILSYTGIVSNNYIIIDSHLDNNQTSIPITNDQIDMFIYCFLFFASIYSLSYKLPYIFNKKKDIYVPGTIINNNNNYTCSICFDNKCDLSIKCNHTFHYNCIKLWYKDHTTCPYCRSCIE